MKRFLAIIMSLIMCFATSSVAYAADLSEPSNDNVEIVVVDATNPDNPIVIPPDRSADYGYAWIDNPQNSSFTVYSTKTGSLNATFKIETVSDGFTTIQFSRPNGTTIVGPYDPIYLDGNNDEDYVSFTSYSTGNYTVVYHAWCDAGMRIMCWIY